MGPCPIRLGVLLKGGDSNTETHREGRQWEETREKTTSRTPRTDTWKGFFFPSQPSEGTRPADTWISAFFPPEPRASGFLLCKPLSAGCFVNPSKAIREGFLLLNGCMFPYNAARQPLALLLHAPHTWPQPPAAVVQHSGKSPHSQ